MVRQRIDKGWLAGDEDGSTTRLFEREDREGKVGRARRRVRTGGSTRGLDALEALR